MKNTDNLESSEENDQIIDNIGHFGRWQLKYFIILIVVAIPTAFPILSITFLNAQTDFWCARPNNGDTFSNVSEWRELSSPLVLKSGDYVRDQCNIWNSSDFRQPFDNSTMDCSSWEYDRSKFPNTLTHSFDLVCDRKQYTNIAQTVYFVGLLVGVFASGWLADVIGRKLALFPAIFGTALFGTISAFMPTIESFIAVRFFHGFFTIGIFTITFVWLMEVVGGKWQTIVGIGFESSWVIGWFTLALIAYLAPNWKNIQLITSIPSFLSLVIIWLLPESPKWLLATGKLKKAEELVKKIVKENQLEPLPDNWKLKPLNQYEKKEKTVNVFDLFKHKNLAIKTIIIYFNWFANSFVYYGLTLNSGSLSGEIMINFLLNGLMEIPAYSFSLWILLKKGRKYPYIGMMIIGGLALFLTLTVPKNYFPNNWPAVVLALIGKLMITGTFSIAYVYSAEIYPTVVRSVGVGSSSLFARLGGAVAPYVGDLADTFGPTFPIAIFGITAILAGISALLLPETQNRKLPDTIEEGEAVKINWKNELSNISI